ncbi:hypothetical protein [Azospirillum sp. ST 5-10]|uniref:hypothetical protein n=1 Tax=unclassified Azospirillum TaxID=2630922 RepID=UPI003F4A283E
MREFGPGGGFAAFLDEGVSVVVSSSDRANRPVLSRALACRVEPDGRRVGLLLSASASAALLDAVAETGRLAVVVTRPSTHRSVQLKGEDARVVPPTAGALDAVAHHVGPFVRDLESIGFEEPFVRTLMACDPADLAALVFTPSAGFDQTPGPKAGDALAP